MSFIVHGILAPYRSYRRRVARAELKELREAYSLASLLGDSVNKSYYSLLISECQAECRRWS